MTRSFQIQSVSTFLISLIVLLSVSNPTYAAVNNDILILFNHGSSSSDGKDCYGWRNWKPKWLNSVKGKLINGQKIVVRVPCTGNKEGKFAKKQCAGDVWVCERAYKIVEIIKTKIEKEKYQPRNIFVGGHSAGGWASLLIKRWNPGLFNGVIATAPAFNGRRRSRLCLQTNCDIKQGSAKKIRNRELRRKWNSKMRLQHDRHLGLGISNKPELRALIFAFQCDPFGHPDEYPFSQNSSVTKHIYPDALKNKTIGCAVKKKTYRHYQKNKNQPTIRCNPIKGWAPSKELQCGSGRAGKSYGQILNCDPSIQKLCGKNQHTQTHRSDQFRDYISSSDLVLDFIAARLKDWKPEPYKNVSGTPCDFIDMDKICKKADKIVQK